MPTVLVVDGFRFFFYSDEGNEPRHIHVEKAEGAGKFWLDPVTLARADGLTRKQLTRAGELAVHHAELFRGKWDEYFGQ